MARTLCRHRVARRGHCTDTALRGGIFLKKKLKKQILKIRNEESQLKLSALLVQKPYIFLSSQPKSTKQSTSLLLTRSRGHGTQHALHFSSLRSSRLPPTVSFTKQSTSLLLCIIRKGMLQFYYDFHWVITHHEFTTSALQFSSQKSRFRLL